VPLLWSCFALINYSIRHIVQTIDIPSSWHEFRRNRTVTKTLLQRVWNLLRWKSSNEYRSTEINSNVYKYFITGHGFYWCLKLGWLKVC
jgi:hypothetical protein